MPNVRIYKKDTVKLTRFGQLLYIFVKAAYKQYRYRRKAEKLYAAAVDYITESKRFGIILLLLLFSCGIEDIDMGPTCRYFETVKGPFVICTDPADLPTCRKDQDPELDSCNKENAND